MFVLNEKGEIGTDKDGFINPADIEGFITKKYIKRFDYVCEINRCMYLLYEKMEPHNEDVIECFFAGTYNKIHKNIQAAIILATRGLQDQVKIIIRSTLDKLLIMQAVINDNYNYNEWLETQKSQITRTIKAIRRGEKGLENLQDHFPADENLPKGKYISQKQWAEMAGMESDYNLVYNLFSGNVHCSIGAYEDDFEFENGRPTVLNITPRVDMIEELLLTIAGYALRSMSIVIQHFNLNDADYNKLTIKFEEFQESVMKSNKTDELL